MNIKLSTNKKIKMFLFTIIAFIIAFLVVKNSNYRADEYDGEKITPFRVGGIVLDENKEPQKNIVIFFGDQGRAVSDDGGYYETILGANEGDRLTIETHSLDYPDRSYSINNYPEGIIILDSNCDDIQMQDPAPSMCEQAEIKNMNLNLHIKSN